MAIRRTYVCAKCNHTMTVTLRSDQWDEPPPACAACSADTRQEFTPIAIGGSHMARAARLAEDIAANDYNVANMHVDNREGGVPKVVYKDTQAPAGKSSWGVNHEALQGAAAIGRQTRLQHGSALDIIKTMPDYVANSKKVSIKGY